MSKLIYLTDSYKKNHTARIVSLKQKGKHAEIILDETIFYPQGGGQPSDKGTIKGKNGTFEVTHVRLQQENAIHEGKITGTLLENEKVNLEIDWPLRFKHMCWHSAGHVMHEVITHVIPGLIPTKGQHSPHEAYIEYRGSINQKLAQTIEKQTNILLAEDRSIKCEFVSYEELIKQASYVPEKLPKNKPLRIVEIEGFKPIPDGGTQVARTSEIGIFKVIKIDDLDGLVRVYYAVENQIAASVSSIEAYPKKEPTNQFSLTLPSYQSLLIDEQQELYKLIENTPISNLEELQVKYFGAHGKATQLIKRITQLPKEDRKAAGMLVNEFKTALISAFETKKGKTNTHEPKWFDTSISGIKPPEGHLHIVSQAIFEISDIFAGLGFTRVRHPEVDWDYYPFESLNMPSNHPARDEWETFFVESQKSKVKSQKFSKMVLTPHTSNGQVREMEKGNLPIRMINIAKCYRRQSDVSHVPMFHQFEGLYVDIGVSIAHLKGVFDYFVKQFFGPTRKTRLRPFHFQFTEPSFEIDISCGVCAGAGCKLCKEGWLELGGAGMVHPVVLRNGGVDPNMYSGFAFGWGVERTYMMKAGTQLDDIRLLYSNDVRFLEQF